MNNNNNNVCFVITVVVTLIGCVVVGGGATTTDKKSVRAESENCGENVTWTLDDEGTLTINGNGEMPNYGWEEESQRNPWYYNDTIKNVVIEKGVTSIGSCAIFCVAAV